MSTSDLIEARHLLEQAEAERDPARKFAALEEGLELLEALADDPTTAAAERQIIRNVRKSSIRRLLEQLTQMRGIDPGAWLDYVLLLVLRFDAEVQAVLKADESLAEGYQKFILFWGPEVVKMLQPKST
jgi:hypothetical protein